MAMNQSSQQKPPGRHFGRLATTIRMLTIVSVAILLAFIVYGVFFESGAERWIFIIPAAVLAGIIGIAGAFSFRVSDDIANND